MSESETHPAAAIPTKATPIMVDNTANAAPPIIKCDTDALFKLIAENKKVSIIFTQKNCGKCDPYLEKVKKDLPLDVALIEIPAESKACDDIQNTFGVEFTPTTVTFKDGVMVDSFVPDSTDQDKNFKRLMEGLAKEPENVTEAELPVTESANQ